MTEEAEFVRPEHVPEELVIDYDISVQAGVDRCPFEANAKVHDLPDIFFVAGSAARRGASWVISSRELALEAYAKADIFSSNNATGFLRILGKDMDLIPVEIDPPLHALYRRILNPVFTPAALSPLEGELRGRAREMIQGILNQDRFEFETSFGRPYPVSIFLDLMRLPIEKLEEFVEWEELLLHGKDMEDVSRGAQHIFDYLAEIIPQRKEDLDDDLLSLIITAKVGDRNITDDEIFAMSFLIFFGGLDTVAATINFIFKHLAENPQVQQQLRDDPTLIPNAVEEFLRAFAVVNSPRVVKQDVEFHGVQMKAGDRVTILSALAGRDPDWIDNPEVVDVTRGRLRHLAFGSGPHTCAGANLARRELRIAIEEWMKLAPAFKIDPDDRAITSAHGVFSVKRLPLVWDVDAR